MQNLLSQQDNPMAVATARGACDRCTYIYIYIYIYIFQSERAADFLQGNHHDDDDEDDDACPLFCKTGM
eukprot:COSAG06_NODE_541_length_14471_cov_35.139229_15_plen_69_part_00